MGRISSLFWPSSYLVDGRVVTIRMECETYVTACEDRKTVTLEKKLEGSNNGQYWTVKVVRNSDGSLTGRFNLKSIYGTFLGARVASSKWLGIVNKYEVCQTSMLEEDDNLGRPPFSVHCCVLARSSKAHLNWYDLRFRYYYTRNICEEYLFLVPWEGRRLRLVRDLPDVELWYIQVVDNHEKEQQKPALTPAPVPSNSALVPTPAPVLSTSALVPTPAPVPSNSALVPTPTPTPTRDPPRSSTKIPSHNSQPPTTHPVKRAYNYLVNNFNNQMVGGGLFSLYNTGLNTNGSGTQKSGDIDYGMK